MRISAPSILVLLAFAGCTGVGEDPISEKVDAQVSLTPPPLDVNEGWPCPPFDVETTEDKVGDTDEDSLTDCQEEQIGSNPASNDSDGDGVGDDFEIGDNLLEPRDTDGDTIIDLLDHDDDDDGVPTVEEVENPGDDPRGYDFPDIDAVPNYLDDDEDNDRLFGQEEGAVSISAPVGDRNGDFDGDGKPNWADDDDDNDGACCGDEDTNGNTRAADDDTNGNDTPDWADLDDDGDGVLTIDENWDGEGTPMDDNIDGDGFSDYQDIDEDGDSLIAIDLPNDAATPEDEAADDNQNEDLNGNGDPTDDDTDGDGLPNFRDNDDDNDGVTTRQEDEDALLPAGTGTTGLGDLLDDDTDGDGVVNYLDDNDDNDACPTADEDTDGNGSAVNDDTDANGVPDFLEAAIADCTPGVTTFRLDLEGSNFTAADAVEVFAVALDGANATISSESAALTGGAFTLTFPDMISTTGTYSIDLFVDSDPNPAGSCLTEDSYRLTGITSAGEIVTSVIDAATAVVEPDACLTFP